MRARVAGLAAPLLGLLSICGASARADVTSCGAPSQSLHAAATELQQGHWAAAERQALLSLSLSSEPLIQAEIAIAAIRRGRSPAIGQVLAAALACHATRRLPLDDPAFEGAFQELAGTFARLASECMAYKDAHRLRELTLSIAPPAACPGGPPRWLLAARVDDELSLTTEAELPARLATLRSLSVVLFAVDAREPALPLKPAAPAQPDPALALDDPGAPQPQPRPLWLLGASAGLLAASAGALALAAHYDDLASGRERYLERLCPGDRCSDATLSRAIEAAKAKGETYVSRRDGWLAGGIVAGVAALGGGLWYFLSDESSETAALRAGGACSPTRCALELSGRF